MTVTQKLQQAYDWYLMSYDTVEYQYGQLPMSIDEFIDYTYKHLFDNRFAPKDSIWVESHLGSIQDDFEKAFKEHDEWLKEQSLQLTEEEFEASENYKNNQAYLDACEYIQRMQNEDYYDASVLMRKYSPKNQYEQFTEFMQYVKDMSNF